MKKVRKKTGLPPGTIVFTGKRKVEKINLHYLEYNEQDFEEQELDNQSISSFHHPTPNLIQWYDIRGLHDTQLIEELGQVFKLHPLTLEAVVDTQQRPKYSEFDNGILLVVKAMNYSAESKKLQIEQLSIYLGDGFIITLQEDETDLLHMVRGRLKSANGRIRKRGADYLAFAILDLIIDNWYLVLDEIQDTINDLESKILDAANDENKAEIYQLKEELIRIRKVVAPTREVVNQFSKTEHNYLDEKTRVFTRNLYDNTVQVLEMTEISKEVLNSLQDLYLSEISFKMNQVMQMLTLIATIFIPLTFLVGVYGMNFENIPELRLKNGYFILWGVMIGIFLLLLYYFRRRKWL